jgi:hypothetical protein
VVSERKRFETLFKSTTAGNRLTLDPKGKCTNAFSEATNMIKAKPNVKQCPAVAAILDFGSA